MTPREMAEVMLAYAGGARVEACSRGTGTWFRSPAPSWDWNNYCFRIAQPPPKKVFGPEDFPPGTIVRFKGTQAIGYSMITQVTSKCFITEGVANEFTALNRSEYANYEYSTDSGATWMPLKP